MVVNIGGIAPFVVDGEDGISVTSARVGDDGHLRLTLSNDTTVDAGPTVGAAGATGAKGDTGPQGPQGQLGPQGLQGEITQSALTTQLTALDKRFPNWVNFTDVRYADPGGDAGKTWNNCVAALGSAGGTIYVPTGTYTGSTVPTLASKIVLRGGGEQASFLLFTGGGYVWSADISKLRFEHISVRSTNGDLFAPTSSGGMNQSTFKHCILENSDGHSIWNQVNARSFQELTFEDCAFNSDATATVPAFNIVNSGGSANSNRFKRCRVNGANNTNRPFFWIESRAVGNFAYDNVFEDIVGEQNPGGLIYLVSNYNSRVVNAQDWDATSTYTGDVVRVDMTTLPSGPQSKWCVVENSGRRGSAALGAGVYDVNIVPTHAVRCIAKNNNYSTGAVTTNYATDTVVMSEDVRGGITVPGGVKLAIGTNGTQITSGTGSPNSAVTGSVGDLFIQSDGTLGKTFWSKASGTATTTGWVVRPLSDVEKFIPASGLLLSAGTATQVFDNTFLPVWSFPNSVDSSVAFQFELPTDWATYTIDLRWLNPNSSSGNVRWTYFTAAVTDGVTLPSNTSTFQVVAAGAQNKPVTTPWISAAVSSPAAGATVTVAIKRVGTDGTDTLGNAAHLLGVYLRRSS